MRNVECGMRNARSGIPVPDSALRTPHSAFPPDSALRTPHFPAVAFWTFSALAVALCAAVEIFPRLVKHRKLAANADELRREITAMQTANERLARQVDALDTDPFYVEQVARRDLGYHRLGERRLRVGKLYEPTPPRRPPPAEGHAWVGRLEELFTYDQSTRRAALVTAAVLILCAFLFFNSSSDQAPTEETAVPIETEPAFPTLERKAG